MTINVPTENECRSSSCKLMYIKHKKGAEGCFYKNVFDHTETDKVFDEKFYTMAVLYSENTKDYYAVILPKDRVEDDEYGLGDIKSFLHKRIELEVEKAVKARDEQIKSAIKEHRDDIGDMALYGNSGIIEIIDSLNK